MIPALRFTVVSLAVGCASVGCAPKPAEPPPRAPAPTQATAVVLETPGSRALEEAVEAKFDQDAAKLEDDTRHAIAFVLGREAFGGSNGPPPDPASKILARVRAAHVALHFVTTNPYAVSGSVGAANGLARIDGVSTAMQDLQGKIQRHEIAGLEVKRRLDAINQLQILEGQFNLISNTAYLANLGVQQGSSETIATVSGLVRSRRLVGAPLSDEDYARVKRSLARRKRYDLLAAVTLGMLAGYQAAIENGGDPKALDALGTRALTAFPLSATASDDEARDYVAHLPGDVANVKPVYERWMRESYGDATFEQLYKQGIDAMFTRVEASQRAAATSPFAQDGTLAKAEGVATVARAAANGDTSAALSGAAELFPGGGPVHASLLGIAALSRGDSKGALHAAIDIVGQVPGGGPIIKDALGLMGTLLKIL